MADANLSSNTITLAADQVKAIRKAMLIGLASYGEIERLCNQAGLQESFGRPLPEEASYYGRSMASTKSHAARFS